MAANEKNIILTAEVKQGEIINNFSAIKAQVEAKIAPFVGLVFGDDDIRDAKGTLADLRKMRTVIEDKRKAIKKQWNEPYDAFEKEVRQITEIIDRPIDEIDSQIKDFEERRKQAKREECMALVDTIVEEIESDDDRDFVKACSVVFDERWLNSTTALSEVDKNVRLQIEKVLADAKTLTEVCEGDDMLTDLLVEYQGSKDLSAVLMKRKRMIEQRDAAERIKKARQAEMEARRAEQEVQAAPEPVVAPRTPQVEPQPQEQAPTSEENTLQMALVLKGNKAAIVEAMEKLAAIGGLKLVRLYPKKTEDDKIVFSAK